MTDFVHVETNGQSGSAFNNWWNNTVPATVPASDRYIFELQTNDLNENPQLLGKQIDGDIIVRAVSGEIHNGTRGTGRVVARSSGGNFDVWNFDCTGTGQIIIEDLETHFSPASNSNDRIFSPETTNTPLVIVRRMLITNDNALATRPINFPSGGSIHLISCRYWDQSGNGSTRFVNGFSNSPAAHSWVVQGNVFQAESGDVQRGVTLSDGATSTAATIIDIQGNIVLGTVEQDYLVAAVNGSTATFEENVSEDATGQVTGATVADDLVSVDNPDVKAGSIALQVWDNKPTTYGAEIDVYGNNRTTVAGSAEWDAGSMQFSTAAPVSEDTLDRAVGVFGSGVGAIGSTVVVPLPFSMKVAKLWYSGIETAPDGVTAKLSSAGTGFASADKGIFTNGATAAAWRPGFSDPFAYRRVDNQNCVTRISGTGFGQGAMQLQSITPTDMTFVITEQFLFNLQISFIALGGDAVKDAIVINFDHNGSVGVQQVAGVPFQPTVGMLAHVSLNDGGGGNALATGGNLGLGVADGVKSWVANVWMGNKVGQVETTHYFKTDEWFATAGADVTDRSIWSAWNADGFDIDHIEASGGTPTIIALLMNIASVEVGTLLTKTDGTDIVSSTGFTAKAWFFGSCGAPENTVNVIAANAEMTLGAATSQTNQKTQGAHAADALPSAIVNVAIDDLALFIKSNDTAATVDALMSLKATGIADFTTVMDIPEPSTPSIVGCVLYGDDASPDEGLDPTGSTLLDLVDNELVDLRHPLTLILEGVDSDTLQLIASGTVTFSGASTDLILNVLANAGEIPDTLQLLASGIPVILIEGVGDISVAPVGSALLTLDSSDDLSLSIIETDHDTFVTGSALSAKIQSEGGVVTFLVVPTGVVLDLALQGSTLGAKTGGLFDPITSGVPAISVSHPTAPPGTAGGRLIIRSITRDVTRPVVHAITDEIQAFNA